jgi:hypothetical protein
MILILGCGRSGTHLLADVMEGPDTVVTKEDPRWFELALAMVRNEATMDRYYKPFVHILRAQRDAAKGKILVDKTHVAAWFLQKLSLDIPLQTIWIEREPLPTIASMMWHNGMRNDLGYSRCFSVPNRFMGIYGEEWFDLSMAQCFAHKWLSYHRRREELNGWIDHFVQYEDLVRYPEQEITKIEQRFGISCSRPDISMHGLLKWMDVLTQAEVSEINEVLEENIE